MHENHPQRIRFARTFRLCALAFTASAMCAPACSNSPDPIGLTGGTSNAGTSNPTGGSAGRSISLGGSSGSGGTSARGSGGTSPILVGDSGAAGEGPVGAAGAAGAELEPGGACALATDTVEALPSVLQLVIDTSGSMDWPPGWEPVTPDDSKPAGATKWEITRDALSSAVSDLDADVALGASFFPDTTDRDPDSRCLRNEVALPIALLGPSTSVQRRNFADALAGVTPYGATPTEGAYLFGVKQLEQSTLAGNRFLLLITDGTPTCTLDCECNDGNVAVDSEPLLADAAAALKDGLRTFVIGSPGSEHTRGVLSALARNGGTATDGCSDDGPTYCHFDMTTEKDLSAGLARALDQVAASLRSCEYPVPPAPNGKTLDPDLVNVLYTPSGGKTETIARDDSKTCTDGWQYSKDGNTIVLCGDACDAAKADLGAKVEVLFGCKTVSHDPR